MCHAKRSTGGCGGTRSRASLAWWTGPTVPPGVSHQMDPAVEVGVLEARRRTPDWGPRRLVHEASRAGVEPTPSRSGIYRALRRAGLIDPKARRRRDRRFRRGERGGAMELWQMDVVGGVLLVDGSECKVLTGIDDHSRFVVCAGGYATGHQQGRSALTSPRPCAATGSP